LIQLIQESSMTTDETRSSINFYTVAGTNIANMQKSANSNILNLYALTSLNERRSKILVEDFHSNFLRMEGVERQVNLESLSGNNIEYNKAFQGSECLSLLIPKNRRIFFTYFYHHQKKYKALEFKLVFSNNDKESPLNGLSSNDVSVGISNSNDIGNSTNKANITKEESILETVNSPQDSFPEGFSNITFTPHVTIKKNIINKDYLKIKSLKVIPMLDNFTIIENLMNYEERLNKNFARYYCSEKYYVSFLAENVCSEKVRLSICCNNSNTTVNSNNENKDTRSNHLNTLNHSLIQSNNPTNEIIVINDVEPNTVKELYLLVNSEANLSNFYIRWELLPLKEVRGKLDLVQVFKEFSYNFTNIIKFNLFKSVESKTGIISNSKAEKTEMKDDILDNNTTTNLNNTDEAKGRSNHWSNRAVNQDLCSEYLDYSIVQFNFEITNTSNRILCELKLYIYLYRENDSTVSINDAINNLDLNSNQKSPFAKHTSTYFFDNEKNKKKIIVNEEIEGLVYEGYLDYEIETLKENETQAFDVSVYLRKYNIINATAVVVDSVNQLVFISPKSLNHSFA